MTKQAIQKLSEQARTFCETKKAIIRIAYESELAQSVNQNKAELRGYLACLLHSGAITQTEFRCLYLFYGTM